MPKWKKLKPLKGCLNPCLCCPPIPASAPMTKLIAVGFGQADIVCDGKCVMDCEHILDKKGFVKKRRDKLVTFATAERLAAKRPNHDWRVILNGPMHGETYQRQGKGKWMLVEKNQGFA